MPYFSSPLKTAISMEETDEQEQRLQQIQAMRRRLFAEEEDDEDADLSTAFYLEPENLTANDATEATVTRLTFARPPEVRVVEIHRRSMTQDSDLDIDSNTSLSFAETLVNQSAEQMQRNVEFHRHYANVKEDVEVLMENARQDQERLRLWINDQRDVVEKLQQRRRSDARLDKSLQMLRLDRPALPARPRPRSIRV